MKSNYPTRKLGEICEIVTGSTPRTSVSAYYGEDILWAGPTDLDQGVYVTNTQKKLTKKGVEEGGARLILKNSVMVSCIGYIGKVAIASEDMATNQQINTFYPKIKDLDSKYLYYALIFKADEFKKSSSQTTLPIINKTKCSNIEIPLPPIAEQRKIVARLEGLLGKIKEAKRLRAEAQEAAQNLLPAELHRIFTKQHTNKLENVGMSGKQKWEEKSIQEITELVTKGTTPKTLGHAFTESGVPFLKAENVNSGKIDATSTSTFISKETHDILSRSKTKNGDVLMTIAGTIGRVGWVSDHAPEMNMNQAVAIIRPRRDITLTPYLAYVLSAGITQSQVSRGIVKAAIPNFSLGMIKKLKIPLPPLAEQKKIVARLDSLSEKIKKLREYQKSTASDFISLEQSILSKSFQHS